MSSYINFRDVMNLFSGGNGFKMAGTTLASSITNDGGPLASRSTSVITKRDSYSQGFWNDTYAPVVSGVAACEPRYLDLIHQGTAWAKTAQTMGEDVVKAATQILWQDAIAAAELASANVVET